MSSTERLGQLRAVLLLALAVLGILLIFILPAIPQPQWYHRFADQRTLFGISNFWNIISNAAFLWVALTGCAVLVRRRAAIDLGALPAYWVFFAAIGLTAAGSAWYHLAPDDARLLWDRLPIALASTALPVALLAERGHTRLAAKLLAPLLGLGVASVIYWSLTQAQEHGDLLPYILVQGWCALALIILASVPPWRGRALAIWSIIGWYALARVAEVLDAQIYALGHLLSGHTLKHLLAALAAAWVLRMMPARQPKNSGAPSAP